MIHIFRNPDTLLTALADFVVTKAKESIALAGRFNFVLSGGSSPKKLYELLATDIYCSKIDWPNVFFFFGDERYVPANHPDSNYLMARKALFIPLRIPDSHIFAMDTTLTPEDSAVSYETRIVKHFLHQACRFDLILLGLGDNSHTASLFPHTTVLHETTALIKGIYIEEVKMYRITFTAPLINMAHYVVFLVYGAGKAEAVHHILEDLTNIEEYPAQLIHPERGELNWFIDEAAAERIMKRN